MVRKVWVSRGPNSGRILEMTEADAKAAVGANWAMEKEPNWTLTDEEVMTMQGDVDWTHYQDIQDKYADPTYTAIGEEDGSWTPPDSKPPEPEQPPPPEIDNTLPLPEEGPGMEKPPPGTEPPLGGSRSGSKSAEEGDNREPEAVVTVSRKKYKSSWE